MPKKVACGSTWLDAAESAEALLTDRRLWGRVWDKVLTETMPPAEMPQPTWQERQRLSKWIGQRVFQLDPDHPDPGRVTIRRLNRQEYRYAILDLLGIDFPVEDHFPADDTGYGFDTTGDVLTVPPTLLDKYFSSAELISAEILRGSSSLTEGYRRVFDEGPPPANRDRQLEYARRIFERISRRAFRRPPGDIFVGKLVDLVKEALEQGERFEEAVGQALVAVLVSPRFFYRAEFHPQPDDPEIVHPLDEHALASRLSFFLWSSLPDQELLELADQGRLREKLSAQLERMMQDSKFQRMIENFVGQWLFTRDVAGIHKQTEFHIAISNVRREMVLETEMLFSHMLREDRNVIELLAADYTYLNELLADYYGIPDITGEKMRLVQLPSGSHRGGILTHGSLLVVTSNPDRTSPVKRGRFVLKNVLGIPTPPPDVPELEVASRGAAEPLTMRSQLDLHRQNPDCAVCHDRMDPMGLGLENFDTIGRWREKEHDQPIDARGELVSGEEFEGIHQLRTILASKQRLFYCCLTRELMTFALGRGIEYNDTPAIENIVQAMLDDDGRTSTMLLGIIQSPQFQLRRGNGNPDDVSAETSFSVDEKD